MPVTEIESWTVLGEDGAVVAPVESFLALIDNRGRRIRCVGDMSTTHPPFSHTAS
ncbi:MAG TPA: hypothetical protein VK988_20080 [Acidimicrobiales bacterium]|nr:hypothetical protein [Acidimicrobiales bacterium]